MSNNVKVKCNKDQRWSFGRLKKDQVVSVDKDIAATMVESGYGEYFGSEEKRTGSPATENKSMDPATENKSEAGSESESESESDDEEAEVDFTKLTKKNDLEAYAIEKFGIDLDKKKSVKNLIAEIQELVDANETIEGDE